MSDTLTPEQGVSLLLAAEQPEQVEAPVVETPEPEAPEAEEPEAEEIVEEEPQQAEVEAVAAPDKWDAEDKAWFAGQPPEIQSKILEQETKREAVLAKAKAKASEEAQQVVAAEMTQVRAAAQTLNQLLPVATAAFQQRWGEPDWKATLETYGPEETMKLQLEYREEQEQLTRLIEAQAHTEQVARQRFYADEARKLSELAPELASDATKRAELASFLRSNGATDEDIANIPAWGVATAYKAFLYDKAQAAAKAPKPAPAARPVLKPAAAQPGTSSQRTVTQLRNRLNQTGKAEDAVALLLAQRP